MNITPSELKSKLTFRQMNLDELKQTIRKQNEECWFLCENEAEAIYSIDPKGFFVSEIEGKVVGTLVIINYGGGLKYGTLYTTLKEYRGCGLGPPLFEYGVKQQDFENPEECSIGESEEHIWPIYKKRGWEILCQELVYRQDAVESPKITGIIDLKTVRIEELNEYDKKVFGYSRESYLKLLLNHEEHFGVAKLNKEGAIIGYGILKKLKPNQYKLAPWYADDIETAKELLQSAQNLIVGLRICVATMDNNDEVQKTMREGDWKVVFSGYRIYKHKYPKTDFSRVYGTGGDFY